MPHYSVSSEILDTRVFVFNSPDKGAARDAALNNGLGERLDNCFDGDAHSSPDYDPDSDLTIEQIADDNVLCVVEERDL